MHDIGPLAAHNPPQLIELAQEADGGQAAPIEVERNHASPLRLDPCTVLLDARRDRDFETPCPRRPRHRQEMRSEKPVFADEEQDFSHQEPCVAPAMAARLGIERRLYRVRTGNRKRRGIRRLRHSRRCGHPGGREKSPGELP